MAEIKREVKAEVKKDVEKELEEDLEKDSERIEEKIEKDIEEEVKKDLSEKGIGKKERVSPIGEAVLEDLQNKWTMFKWAFGIFLALIVCLCCFCYSIDSVQDSDLTSLPLPEPEEVVDHAGTRLPYGTKTAVICTLVLCPIGIATRISGHSVSAIFWLNLLAIVPEAFLLGVATEELALHMGDAVGAMLNASFGNAVELIFVYFTLKDGLLDATAGSLVGSILSNHLVLLGCSMLVGGMLVKAPRRFRLNKGTPFSASAALDQSQQLLLASFAITLPAIFAEMHHVTQQHVVALSLGFSCFLILSYIALVVHEVVSPKHGDLAAGHASCLSVQTSIFMLLVSTLFLAASSECMVHALDNFCHQVGLSQTFVGVVLLPLAGDISHWTAVYMAMRGKMDLSIQIALASAVQIALVVVPLSVFIGQWMGQPMTLSLGAVQGVVLNISAIITFAVLVDGKSNWLRGVTLLTCFTLICLTIFLIPDVVQE